MKFSDSDNLMLNFSCTHPLMVQNSQHSILILPSQQHKKDYLGYWQEQMPCQFLPEEFDANES